MEYPFVELEFEERTPEAMRERAREFYEELSRRRSVRHFSPREVPREAVIDAVRTAGTAPSGAHKQPWSFVLVESPEVKAKIREAAELEEKKSYEERMPAEWLEDLAPLGTDWHKPYLETCPFLIAVFARPFADTPAGKRKHYYVQESVGIAVGFLLAALHRAGIATLTHTPSPMNFLRDVLGRPGSERAYMLIALGFPEKDCKVPDLSRKSLEEILSTA